MAMVYVFDQTWKEYKNIMQILTHWLQELFTENAVLDILEIFNQEMSYIRSNLLKKAFATWRHAFLSTSTMFYDIFAQAYAEIKILRLFIF